MPRVGQFIARVVAQRTVKRMMKIVVLGLAALTVSSVSVHGQGTCTAPWNTFPFLYGTINITGSGTFVDSSGVTMTTDQHISVGVKAESPPQCAWSATNPGGAINYIVTINDSQQQPGCLTTWVGSGGGQSTQEANAQAGFGPTPGVYFVNTSGGVNGILTNGCAGTTTTGPILWGPLPALQYTPSGIPIPSSPLLSGSAVIQGPSFDLASTSATWLWVWDLSPLPDKTCDPCKKKLQKLFGSEIASRNQSLGEDIPIVGTPFSLHYESDRQMGRAGADAAAVAYGMQFGGWTLSVHHALEPQLLTWCLGGGCTPYAVVPKALYMGNGETRSDADVQAAVALNGNTLLTSEDGSEVYEFDGISNLHVSTLRPMTGAKLYSFAYDANGYLVTVRDASGNVTTIQRNAKENPTAIVAPFGQKTTLAVDANGYLSQVTDLLGRVTKLKTGPKGLLASLTDPKGNVYPYQYDTYGQLSLHSDPAGGFISLAHTDTATGFSVSEKTAMGVSSGYNVVLSNTSTSTTEQYTNTWSNGLVANETETQLGGQITESTTLPDGSSYSDTLSGDPRWGIQAPVEASSKITLGNLIMSATSARTATLGTAGDPFSLTTQTETDTINGRKYTSVFTGSTRTYVDTTPVGRKATTVLDSLERISSAQLGTLLPVQYTYDTHARLSTATQGTRQATFSYNASGFLASLTDPLGLTDSFTYDADGHVLTTILADGRIIHFTYDTNGNLSSLTPPGKTAHTFAYNTVNFPSKYTPPVVTGAGGTTYAYDKDQKLTTITRPDTKKVTFNYDTAGRLSQMVAPTETVNFAYNATTGNLASASIPSGESIAYGYNGPLPTSSTWSGTVAGSISRTFNNNFWMASQSLNGANTITFTYDNDGLVTKAGAMTLTNDPKNGLITATTLGSVTDTRTYNTFGELTGYTAKYKTTPLYAVTYKRDADGRIASKVETINGRTTTYVYNHDKAGRLTGVSQNGTSSSTYGYDTNSNRLSATTASGSATGSYDAQDRLLTYGTSTFSYTPNGELASQKTGTQTTQYQYDVLGNLVSVTLPNATKLTYLVDPENHRVAKQVNGTQQTGYLYDGDQIVAQLNSSNQIVSQFVYATGLTSPDYMVTGGVTYRIISDQLGSPRLVVNTATGAIAEQMNYDEFGNVLLDSDAGFQPFGFAGGLKDPDTGFVRYGARDYDPTVGRWAAKDPILFDGGYANLYGYVLNDPVNLIDPLGTTDPDLYFDSARVLSRPLTKCGCEEVYARHLQVLREMKYWSNEMSRERYGALGDRLATPSAFYPYYSSYAQREHSRLWHLHDKMMDEEVRFPCKKPKEPVEWHWPGAFQSFGTGFKG
jgi:RHS repeat-associated protein